MSDKWSPQRKRMRLNGYDYSDAGLYFVTICVKNRLCLLGHIENQVMNPSPAGQMVDDWWQEIAHKYTSVELAEYVIMPNHVHGVIQIYQGKTDAVSLPDVMRWFKSMSTNTYIHGVNSQGWPAFAGSLWQRSYYDHIIRNEADDLRIREYILYNPARWHDDSLYTTDL